MKQKWANLKLWQKILTIALPIIVLLWIIGTFFGDDESGTPETSPTPEVSATTEASPTPEATETSPAPEEASSTPTEDPTDKATEEETQDSAPASAKNVADWETEIAKSLAFDSLQGACAGGISWTCFINGIEPLTDGTILVTLQITENDKEHGNEVARNIFNLTGLQHPELQFVQVNNATDDVLANVSRKTIPLLNR